MSNTDLNFKVIIPDSTFQKVMWWVNKSKFEVSGFAHVDYDAANRTFLVGDPFLCDQENASTETEMDATAVSKAMYQLAVQGKELRWWWHSHVDMGVFWSGTDMSTINQLGSNGWILATVFNKRSQMLSAFCGAMEVGGQKIPIFQDKLDTEIQRYLNKEVTDQWDSEYEQKVKNRTYKFANPTVPSLQAGAGTQTNSTTTQFETKKERKRRLKRERETGVILDAHGRFVDSEDDDSDTGQLSFNGDEIKVGRDAYTSEEIDAIADMYNVSRADVLHAMDEFGHQFEEMLGQSSSPVTRYGRE